MSQRKRQHPTHEDRLFFDRLHFGEHFDEGQGGRRRCLTWAEGRTRRAAAAKEGASGLS